MADILTQNQIDDLLNALNSGEVSAKDIEEDQKEKKVRSYDFRRPDKFAKDQLRTIETIHENFARLVNNYLNGYLRTLVDVQLISTESLIYSEFSNSITNPAILGVIDFKPLEGQIIIDMGTNLGYAMIEKLLGGQNRKSGTDIQRSLTEIEHTLIKNILDKFLVQLRESWSRVIELEPKISSIETSSQFAQIVSPAESIALVTFEMKIDGIKGLFNIAIPYYVLEPIIQSLSSQQLFGKKDILSSTDETVDNISNELMNSALPIKVEVGKSNLSVYELLSLSSGDVLILDKKMGTEMNIYVRDKIKFKGLPGINNKHLAVKLTKVIKEGGMNSG